MQLKWIQHPNPRLKPLANVCQYPSNHPIAFEPEYLCDHGRKKNLTCIPCLGLKKARSFINKSYAAQHSECNTSDSTGETPLDFVIIQMILIITDLFQI